MAERFHVDDMIGEYRVTGFLGEGGMGVVYRGVHEKLGRSAAIKILSSTAAGESFKTRFLNEARLQAGLHHPNVATLYDFREQGTDLFIFMELVDGECLGEMVSRRAFTVDAALEVFSSVCEAIAYIHSHGVIHRDIKAQNAKLTAAGVVKLLDFGIAKDAASQGLTQTGGVIGTPNYLSPEQLDGKPASRQTDIWALGVLLYEMLTGQLPFQGETMGGLVLRITRGDFPPPDTINPAVSRDVSAIVSRCLKKDTNSRFRSVDDLLSEVRRVRDARAASASGHERTRGVFAQKPVVTRPTPDHEPDHYADVEISQRKPFPLGLVAGLGGGALVLLLLVVVGVYMFAGGETPQAKTALVGNSPGVSKGNTRIRVDVDEGKAQVFRGSESLGLTPLDLDANLGDNIPLTLRRDGFEDKNVSIQVSPSKKVFTFSLKSK